MNLQILETMLHQGRDTPLLRFGLGKGYLDGNQPQRAVEHLRRCVEIDPDYTAAWKLLGKALLADGDSAAARSAWSNGVLVAKRKGDRQAEKEMGVFIRRVDKQAV